MAIGVDKATLERLLAEKKAMCNCGCGWGESDGHEWEILLLEELLQKHLTTISGELDTEVKMELPEFLKKQAD